jgi:hypothetical protein
MIIFCVVMAERTFVPKQKVYRDPHGMLRYYLITNENSLSQFVVLVSSLWRDMEECEAWSESPTASR